MFDYIGWCWLLLTTMTKTLVLLYLYFTSAKCASCNVKFYKADWSLNVADVRGRSALWPHTTSSPQALQLSTPPPALHSTSSSPLHLQLRTQTLLSTEPVTCLFWGSGNFLYTFIRFHLHCVLPRNVLLAGLLPCALTFRLVCCLFLLYFIFS